MTTDDLIAALSRDLTPAPRTVVLGRVILALAIGLLAGLVLLRLTFGLRPDIGIAAPVVAAKAGFGALVATVALGLALRAARPGGGGRGLALVVLACGAMAVGATSLLTIDPAERTLALTGGGFPWCVLLIPALGAPTAGLLAWALREAAPTRLVLAGALIGALSGGVGTMIYSLYCPIDSLPFVTTWYVLAVAVAAALGALLGSRLLRW